MTNIDWVLVLTLIVAVLQAILSVLQSRANKKLDGLRDSLDKLQL